MWSRSQPAGTASASRVRSERWTSGRYWWGATRSPTRSWGGFVEANGERVAFDVARRAHDPQLADHPATGLTFAEAEAFCAWATAELARPVRLPTGGEWEAAARGHDARPWPWGHTFDPERC